MALFATAGATLQIGGVLQAKNADFVLADFSSETWVEIDHLENLGSIGDTVTEVQFDSIPQRRVKRFKGTRAAPPIEVIAGIDYADAGQIALIAAEKADSDYAFKITFPDAPSGGTPSERYFIATVASATEALDTANNVAKLSATLWVNSNVVRVDAVAP